MKRPGSLLPVTLASIVVNIAANWLFIHIAPSPAWAVAGIGASTALVQVFTLAVYWVMVRRDGLLAPYVDIRLRPGDMPEVWALVRLGTPVSLTYGSEAAITTAAALVMGTVSAPMLAAHNVVNQIAYVVYQVCIGFSHGGSILVSQALSRGRAVVGQVAAKTLQAALAYLSIVGVIWLVFGRFIVRAFLGHAADPTAAHMATVLPCIAVLQQYAKGSQNVLVGLLRGLRDTASGLKATIVGYWFIGVPAIVLLGRVFHFGGWAGLVAGFGTTAALLAREFSAACGT